MRLRSILGLTLLLAFLSSSGFAQDSSGINVGIGSIVLLKKADVYGAIVPRSFEPAADKLSFDWYLLPAGVLNLGSPACQKGYNIVLLEDGSGSISFGHFTLTVEVGPGGQLLLRSAKKPGLHSNNIYFAFAYAASPEGVDLEKATYEFALLPGPPRTVAFDYEEYQEAIKPTPIPENVFSPANGTVLSATDPVFKWPAKKGAVAYRIQVSVLKPGLMSKGVFPIAESRRVDGTSIQMSDMEPVKYQRQNVSPMYDIDGILAENAPDELVKPFAGPRERPGPLVPGRLYGWRVIPIEQNEEEFDFTFDFTNQKDSLYKTWLEFKYKETEQDGD